MMGEEYGPGPLHDRDHLECQPAREIIAGLTATDTMMMVDEEEATLLRVVPRLEDTVAGRPG